MASTNLQRMIQLAEDVFATNSDPNQLGVDQEVIERLQRIHPSSVLEQNDANGPIAWVLLIPTTLDLMNQFLEHKISEKELFLLTPLDIKYEALYLCSAMVLEEFRRKGIVKQLVLNAIENIRNNHPLKAMFEWAFSKEGDLASETLARLTSLPLYKRTEFKDTIS